MKTTPQRLRSIIKLTILIVIGALSTLGYAQTPTTPDGASQEQVDKETKDLKQTKQPKDLDEEAVKPTPLPLEKIKTFAEIFTRIKRNYVTEVSDETLLEYAVEGMLTGLDPHSVYLKGERYKDLHEGTTGRFGGLGLEVMMEDGFIKVVAPIDDTPASEAGIKSGDIIIRIDGKSIPGKNLQQATERMRGEPGTSITLTILRNTKPEPFDLELERAVVRVSSIRRKQLSEEIGYLRVSQFQIETSEMFRKELKTLRDGKNFKGLILDLRNNPGGLLNSAISIADAFIDEGIIVSTKGRQPENDQKFSASTTDMINGMPLVVLINGGSASASEIVAGALQDHKRALILGTESFGKGSVQTVMDIGETQAIKLTTARYYTPSGRSIQAAGIVPDVRVEYREFKDRGQSYSRVKENDLPGHLENENKLRKNKKAIEVDETLARDYQLNEAFNLIKGLVLFQKKQLVVPAELNKITLNYGVGLINMRR
ncbi:MAG: carboxyl-terminal processing protease [Alteromonas macleodii]|jgi:carboxyl-terminal processing protease